ncbi:MAG TPA: hypothetical protein DCS63_09195 [Elusimicrobia bacterium]|nr:hypothetical protein [Elusimicrobiota bacterium]
MNFYNEDEKKDGAPAAPGMSTFKKTSAFGKSPMFSRTAGGIMDRIKNLSRKDMAFVGIGLSVLVLAPVAEYMMSKPSADNLLVPGFGSREGSAASGLYEPGINALSQGSPDGSGEVITPLSSRDPASLILGSQPAAPALPPPSAPATSFRDAMKDAGRNAFSEATRSAGAPTPVPRMQSALRSFGSFFSGGEGTRTTGNLSGGKIIDDAKSASGKAAKRSMMGPVAMPGYKGVASNTPNSSSRGAYEKLRSAADKSAGNFSGGSAMNSLDKAAADALDIGKGGGGLGAGGESDKTTKPSGSTTKYDHNRSGETLAEMAAKQRQQKELDWEFYKKYEIPKQIINAMVGAVGGVLAEVVKDTMGHIFGMDTPGPKCWVPQGKVVGTLAQDWAAARKDCAGSADPKCVIAKVCTMDGGPTIVSYQAGKESALAYEKNCMCNDYAGKTGGAGAQNPPPDPTVTDPSIFGDYDTTFKEIVQLTAEAEVSSSKVEENSKKVVAGFKVLSKNVKGPLQNTLSNYKGLASSAHSDYALKVNAAQLEMNRVKPLYDTFVAQLKVVEEANKQQNVVGEKDESDNSQFDTKGEEKNAKIKEALKQWGLTGPMYFETASGLMAAQHRWSANYKTQIDLVGKGIGALQQKQADVDSAVAAIESADSGAAAKLKSLTGRPIADPAAPTEAKAAEGGSESPLRKESYMRGADWDILWAAKHDLNTEKAEAKETKDWGDWTEAVASGKDNPPMVNPDGILSNQMRSKEIKDSITSERLPSVETIKTSLADTEKQILMTKNQLLGLGVSSSYFGGGAVTPPADGGNGDTPSVPVNTDALNGQVGDLQGEYSDAFAAANKIPSNTAVDPAHRPTYDSMVEAYKASPEYNGLKRDTARLGALQKELAGKVTADRAKAIEAEVGQIRGRLDANRSGAMKGLVVLNKFVADHPYKPASGGGTANPPVVTPVTPVTPVNQPVNTDVLKLQVDTLLGHYNDAFAAANNIPSREKVAVKHRAAYDKKVAAYKASREYTALKADIARLTGFQKELTGKVTADRAKAIGAEVNRIRGRLSANKSGALYGLSMLKKFVDEHPYHASAGGNHNGGSAQPTHPVQPAKPSKLESYPDAADAVEKAGDARMIWMNARKSSDGALDHWRTEEDTYNKKLKLGKDDPFYGVKHPAYTGQLLSQQKRMDEAAANYRRLQPETDRAYQAYDGALKSARLLLNKYKLPLTYLPK